MRDVLTLEYGSALPKKERSGEGFPVFVSNGIVGYHKNYFVKVPGIIVRRKGSAGIVNWSYEVFSPIDTTYYVKVGEQKMLFRYAYYLLEKLEIQKMIMFVAVPGLNREMVYQISYKLPHLEIQRQIVEKLDRQMQALEGVRLLKSEAQKRIEEILAKV